VRKIEELYFIEKLNRNHLIKIKKIENLIKIAEFAEKLEIREIFMNFRNYIIVKVCDNGKSLRA
jgi:hypothetical protein